MNDQIIPAVITIGELYGQKKVANITIENARFWGRPNFSGELDRFKDSRRKFTVIIPNDLADDLRNLGWNVKTQVKTMDHNGDTTWVTYPSVAALPELAADQEVMSSLKVMLNFRFDDKHPGDVRYEKGPEVWLIMGGQQEQLNSRTVGILDRTRVTQLDMEIRAWEYDPEDDPGKYSARLVKLVATGFPSIIDAKYGRLGGPGSVPERLE